MEAPTPIDNGGSYLHQWGCPLCHRDPIDPRVASCGHTYCLLCLRDIQLTAELFKYPSRCNLCHADISDPQPAAYAPHRVLLPPTADPRHASQGPTVGDALAALHQRATHARNYYASGVGGGFGANMAYQQQPEPQLMSRPPHHHLQQMPRYGPHSRIPSSDQVVNTIESSPRASTALAKAPENQEDKMPTKNSLKGLAFHLKGEFEHEDEAHKIIEQNGGRITAAATKRTNYIVMGAGARKTKAMKENSGVVLDEARFWKLMQEKIEDIHEQFHSLQSEEEKLASEETKLKLELLKLERKTGDIKRRLDSIEEAKAGIKKQKLEEAGLLDVSEFVEKSED